MANSSSQRLADWLESPSGARLLAEECRHLSQAARRFHGDTLLWQGCHAESSRTVRGCMVRNRLFASELTGEAPDELSRLSCEPEALPLPNNSVDAMVLHHALDVAEDARGSLREAARVLVPGGRLVVCGFNPLSLWGVRRAYAGVCRDSFSGLRFVTTYRLQDWLTLLGFERQGDVRYLAYTLPFASRRGTPRRSALQSANSGIEDLSRSGDRSHEEGLAADHSGRMQRLLTGMQPPVGGVYVISTVKQVAAIRPRWRSAPVKGGKLVPAAYPKTAVKQPSATVLNFSDWKDLERGR